ncbi:MAG: alpha/beta hydrolase [Deltaproteobacteria bacterium]|nr:alpha/beta hydrolase [Deltaproteobacteria bacterium]
MVTRGQFLERPTLIPVGTDVLEGLSHRGVRAPALLILPPDPGLGGDMQHVVAAELTWAATQAGHATLRFNHRGVGASQGRRGDSHSRLEDAHAALRLLLDNSAAPAAVLAALPGAGPVAFQLASACPHVVRAIALVSPPSVEAQDVESAAVPVRTILGALDAWHPSGAVLAALTRQGGAVDVVEHADQRFLRNLPQVGRAVAALMADVRA